MEIRSTLIGAGATVAVAVGIFAAVAASNADEQDGPPVEPAATVEVVTPEPTLEPTATPTPEPSTTTEAPVPVAPETTEEPAVTPEPTTPPVVEPPAAPEPVAPEPETTHETLPNGDPMPTPEPRDPALDG